MRDYDAIRGMNAARPTPTACRVVELTDGRGKPYWTFRGAVPWSLTREYRSGFETGRAAVSHPTRAGAEAALAAALAAEAEAEGEG